MTEQKRAISEEIDEINAGRKHHQKVTKRIIEAASNAIEDGVMENLIYQNFIKL